MGSDIKKLFVSKAQQIEGLTSISKNISLEQYIRSIKAMRHADFISKSHAVWVLSVIRKAKGVSYQDFIKLYGRIK